MGSSGLFILFIYLFIFQAVIEIALIEIVLIFSTILRMEKEVNLVDANNLATQKNNIKPYV